MKHVTGFLNSWHDAKSIMNLKRSDKSRDVHKAEIENILKAMSYRFERSPQPGTIQAWAQDLVDAGYEDWMVNEACKIIPFKLERHPSLSQLMDLLRPHLANKAVLTTDELDHYTQITIPHLRARFIALIGDEIYAKMIRYYQAEVMPTSSFSIEIAMLGDWCRAYLTKEPKKIIEQGKISNAAAERGDREYFLRPLKLYAKENNLA